MTSDARRKPRIHTSPFAALLLCFALLSCAVSPVERTDPQAAAPVQTVPSRIAITVDDLPYVMPSRTAPDEGLGYAKQMSTALQERGIRATGFAVGGQINSDTRPALAAFAAGGHTIGNHSWSHPDYGTLSEEAFLQETRRTDEVLAEWITGPRYYRFPFLREGETEAAKDAADRVLASLGYQNVPVTIDNDEWQYNADYVSALERGRKRQAQAIAAAYIAHMQERTAHFQSLAIDELGGDVDHILLLHLNRINADHLETLLDWYADQGWAFIPVGEALKHPVFEMPDRYAGPEGLSQIERVLGGKSD